jgi:hypothetical protein
VLRGRAVCSAVTTSSAKPVVARPPRRWSEVAYASSAMALASVAPLIVLEIWHASLNVPFAYGDDSILNLMVVKGVLENGWYLENPRLGAPLGQELYDYPVFSGDHLNLVVFKLLGLFTRDPAAVLNVFFLLTFPLVALTGFLVMRRLRISAGPAIVCSALYALLPYHFLRGETHLFLSAYYAAPLAAYLVLAVMVGESLFARRSDERTGPLGFASGRTITTFGICLVIAFASGSFYYSGFAILLLGAATLLRFAVVRRVRALATGSAVAMIILVLSALNASPTLVYHLKHGGNEAATERQPFESEYYSLRLSQLILPLDSHRSERLASVRRTYDGWSASTGVDNTEAALATLGTVATLGFLGLLAIVLVSAVGGQGRQPLPLLRAAGAATVVALLFATMGGFSSVIGLITPQLRSWNRLSIFIAFFALIAVAAALDRAGRALEHRKAGRTMFASLLAAALLVGALDQTSGAYVPAYEETANRYRSDRAFVQRVENQLPSEAAVFQLPYASFPESVPPPPGRTVVYDPLRPYLHSKRLRWSFGAMRGRPADWAARLADEPLAEVVPVVSAVGFDAIYVDRLGYADDATANAAERELVEIVGRRPMISEDGRLLLFNLGDYNERLRTRLSERELARLRAQVLPT